MTTPTDLPKIPITVHLVELRQRLVRSLLAVAIGFGICYGYSETLLRVFTAPLVRALPPGQQKLVVTGLAETFMVHLKVSLVAGLVVALPYVFYQIWLFIAPGLYRNEQKAALPVVAAACVLFAVGASFAYFVVLPIGIRFLLGYSSGSLTLLPLLREYLAFAGRFLLAFGIVFEMPLISFVLSRLGIVNHRMLSQSRRYAIVVIFIIAAIFTPPDVMSQMMMAIPLLVLYEISIWVARLFGKAPEPAEKTTEPA
ncbi:MAG: twin-arginine translocase subunit TatC [Pseudomonadota bacterium]